MKSEITNNPVAKEYPKLMRSRGDGAIVLFQTHRDGVVVHGSHVCDLGNIVHGWDMTCFVDLPPGFQVTLAA